MKYFKPEILEAEDAQAWTHAKESYWQHVESIRQYLPKPLLHLHLQYSLHDCTIRITDRVHEGSDIVMVLDGCRNGHIGDTDPVLFMLHFICVSDQEWDFGAYAGADILYVEVDTLSEGRSEFRALLSNGSECAISFEDFDFYLHDYL